MDIEEPVTSLNAARQEVTVRQGVDADTAKRLVKALKASKPKVRAQIQGDRLRVGGNKRDYLQAAIAHLRGADWGLPVQFINFRD